MAADDRAFPFLPLNARAGKPRTRGVTEIRGPYYTPVGRRYLEDVLETMGVYVDALTYAGGSFSARTDARGISANEPPAYLSVSTQAPIVSSRSAR